METAEVCRHVNSMTLGQICEHEILVALQELLGVSDGFELESAYLTFERFSLQYKHNKR